MAKNNNNVVRFAVGPVDEWRSAIWRLWSKGNDIYLAGLDRRNKLMVKFSLHASGKWRWAFTEDSGVKEPGSSDRVIRRWNRPTDFFPGWYQGPSIIVPHVALRQPFIREEARKDIFWIRYPRPGHVVQFDILISRPIDPNFRVLLLPGALPLSFFTLPNGEVVWLYQKEVQCTLEQKQYFQEFVDTMRVTMNKPPDYWNDVFAMIYNNRLDTSGLPYMENIPIGYEHFYFEET